MYTLHKLPEGFIITSDEEIKDYDNVLDNVKRIWIKMEPCFVKVAKENHYGKSFKIIAQQDQIEFSSLKEEEQKEIGWYDIEKICVKDLEGLYGTIPDIGHIDETYVSGFKTGFFVAQELLFDRRFTLEDMNQSVFIGARNSTTPEKAARELNNYIQSLSKQSWKVELEMEFIPQALPQDRYKPTLTDGKVKILKLL
jgi:hypothetical protein